MEKCGQYEDSVWIVCGRQVRALQHVHVGRVGKCEQLMYGRMDAWTAQHSCNHRGMCTRTCGDEGQWAGQGAGSGMR